MIDCFCNLTFTTGEENLSNYSSQILIIKDNIDLILTEFFWFSYLILVIKLTNRKKKIKIKQLTQALMVENRLYNMPILFCLVENIDYYHKSST